jgi:hypothetical protein
MPAVQHKSEKHEAMLLSLQDAFRLFEGLPCADAFSLLIVVADQPSCWRLESTGETIKVTTHPAQPKSERPAADVTTWYKDSELATKDFRGEISEVQWMKLYTRGVLRFQGSFAYAKKLEGPFKDMLSRYTAETASAATAPAATTPAATAPAATAPAATAPAATAPAATAPAATRPVRAAATLPSTLREATFTELWREIQARIDEGHQLTDQELSDASSIIRLCKEQVERRHGNAPAAIPGDYYALLDGGVPSSKPWWRVHLGTDLLMGSWLLQLGTVLYTLVLVRIVWMMPTRLDKWCELVAAFIFVVGTQMLVTASYPEAMIEMLERLAEPPK